MRSKYKFKSGKIFLFLIVLILFIIFISLLFVNNKFKSKIQNPGRNVDVINEKCKEEIISKTEDKKDKVISNSSITIPASGKISISFPIIFPLILILPWVQL